MREALGDEAGVAALLTNLALVAEDEGDLDEAERLGQEGLVRRRALGDRRAVSVSQTNMGMLATVRGDLQQALERFVEAHALADEVGDRWLKAVGLHNLGNVTRDLGQLDDAAGHFLPVLDAYAENDDRWSLAHVFEDVAVWLLARGPAGDAEAVSLLAAAERLREEIGAPRFPPTEAALAEALAPAQTRTPADVLERAAASGRTADLDLTVRRAASCSASSPPLVEPVSTRRSSSRRLDHPFLSLVEPGEPLGEPVSRPRDRAAEVSTRSAVAGLAARPPKSGCPELSDCEQFDGRMPRYRTNAALGGTGLWSTEVVVSCQGGPARVHV